MPHGVGAARTRRYPWRHCLPPSSLGPHGVENRPHRRIAMIGGTRCAIVVKAIDRRRTGRARTGRGRQAQVERDRLVGPGRSRLEQRAFGIVRRVEVRAPGRKGRAEKTAHGQIATRPVDGNGKRVTRPGPSRDRRGIERRGFIRRRRDEIVSQRRVEVFDRVAAGRERAAHEKNARAKDTEPCSQPAQHRQSRLWRGHVEIDHRLPRRHDAQDRHARPHLAQVIAVERRAATTKP